MQFNVKKELFFYLNLFSVSIALFFLRIYKLENIGLTDFDAVKSWQIVSQILEHNFQNLFHHASPSFFLFFALFQTKNFLILEYINAILQVFSLVYLVWHFSKFAQISNSFQLLLLSWVGTSVLLVQTARTFNLETLSLAGVHFLLVKFAQFAPNFTKIQRLSLMTVFGIILTINYKILIFLPFFLLYILNQKKSIFLLNIQNYIDCGFVLGIIFGFYSIFGTLFGLHFLTYSKFFYVVAFVKDVNPNAKISWFNLDFSYYFQYIYFFEFSLFLMLGIGIFTYCLSRTKLPNTLKVLFFWTSYGLVLMFFLQKAPRGLLPFFTLLYCFVFWICYQNFSKSMLQLVMFVMICYNLYMVNCFILKYSSQNYTKIVDFLRKNQVKKIYTTVGIGIVPFLPKEIETEICFSEQKIWADSTNLEKYVLIDDYYIITQQLDFEQVLQSESILSFHEPSLCLPLPILEHSEYIGFGFQETLQIWKKISSQSVHLRLVKIKN